MTGAFSRNFWEGLLNNWGIINNPDLITQETFQDHNLWEEKSSTKYFRELY